MSYMNPRTQASPRRVRRAGIVASLVAVAAVLAGCSSSSEDSASSGADMAAVGVEAPVATAAAEGNKSSAEGLSTTDRSVIVTGAMYMTVDNPIAAADQTVSIVQNAGGRIDARSETAPDDRDGGSASLTLRIPSDKLDAVVDDLRVLGAVDQFSTDSYDVTTEVTDLDAKISTLRASTERIEGLLVDAKDIKDIITLEQELDSRQAQLESLVAQQRGLADQVSMSTISLSLTTEPVVIVDDSPETFWDGLVSGWNGLVTFVSVALVIVGVLLPWLALAALITLAAVVAVRSRKSRRARRVAGSPAAASSGPAQAAAASAPSQSPASAHSPARAAGAPDDQAPSKRSAQDSVDGDR